MVYAHPTVDSTFLCYLARSKVVLTAFPIAHSVLSGLDNELLMKREGPYAVQLTSEFLVRIRSDIFFIVSFRLERPSTTSATILLFILP